MAFFTVSFRVRYAETDQMGVAHHAAYPVWFELARSELARARGIPYGSWEERGYFLVVTELHCRFFRPAHYDQLITVGVRVAERKSRGFVFAYRVENQQGQLLAEGSTGHILVDKRTRRPVICPPDLAQLFQPNGG